MEFFRFTNLPDETKKVTKIFIFTPLCGTSEGFMKTVKEILGRVRVNKKELLCSHC